VYTAPVTICISPAVFSQQISSQTRMWCCNLCYVCPECVPTCHGLMDHPVLVHTCTMLEQHEPQVVFGPHTCFRCKNVPHSFVSPRTPHTGLHAHMCAVQPPLCPSRWHMPCRSEPATRKCKLATGKSCFSCSCCHYSCLHP
jgi:hypothetical protein